MGDIFQMVVDSIMGVISGVQGVVSTMQDSVIQPMNQINQTVQGGEWIGTGADQFVNDISSQFIPGMNNIVQTMQGFGGNLSSAIQIMQEADQICNQIVSAVGDVFDAIF